MEIRGVWLSDFTRIVERVSRDLYDGNLKVNDDAHPMRVSRRDHLRGLGNTRARLAVKDSYAYGARRTVGGRHSRSASWEAYRDVLAALFEEYPDARVRTGLANYVGQAGFQELYPATARHNVGSPINPVTMPQLSVGTSPAVDFMALNRDEVTRLAALAAERLAENQQYRQQYQEPSLREALHDRAEVTAQAAYDVLRLNAENAANPGMIALREYVAAHPENWIDGQANPIAFMDAATDAENAFMDAAEDDAARRTAARQERERNAAAWATARRAERERQYRDMVAENEAERQERGVRRAARELAEDLEDERAVARAEGARNSGAESMLQEINKLLAEVAEEGWTNPYEHEDSPARKLA